jgi:hypothetical protein
VKRLYRALRNTVVLTWLVVALAMTSLSATIWAATMTWKTAQLTATATAIALRHRKDIARLTAQSTRKLSELAAGQKAQIARLTANHRAALRRALLRAKARARIRRYVIAVPFLGAAAVAYFEKRDFDEWQAENPDGTETEYLCLVYSESRDIVSETTADANAILAAIPDNLAEYLPAWVPEMSYRWIAFELPDLNALLPACAAPPPTPAAQP